MTGTPLADLLAAAGKNWHVEHGESILGMWSAERRTNDGRTLRYLVAKSAGELTSKILAAEEEDGGE